MSNCLFCDAKVKKSVQVAELDPNGVPTGRVISMPESLFRKIEEAALRSKGKKKPNQK